MNLLSGQDNKNRKKYRPFQVFTLKRGIYLLFCVTSKGSHHVYCFNTYKNCVYLGDNRIEVIDKEKKESLEGLHQISKDLGISWWESVYLVVKKQENTENDTVYPFYDVAVKHGELKNKLNNH